MFERAYYTVSELAEKLTKQFKETIKPQDLIHLGIKGKLPIYICPQFIASRISITDVPQALEVKVEISINQLPHPHLTLGDFALSGEFLPPTPYRHPREFERLGAKSLAFLDRANIYQLTNAVQLFGLEVWPNSDDDESLYGTYIELYVNARKVRDNQIITDASIHLTDLIILGSDVQNLENEYQASQRGQTDPASSENGSIDTRISYKPFDLIRQLIRIIEPDADFSKHSQLHGLLEAKLPGEEKLVVSPNTLNNYLKKES